MKISDVSVTRYRQGGAERRGAEIQIVEVQTDAGVTGTGFVAAAGGRNTVGADFVASLIRDNLRAIVLGQDPVLTERLWRSMYEQVAPRRGARGLLLNAIAGVDFALWDIKAKLIGAPLGDLFGDRKELIATYANAAHCVDPDEAAATAAAYVAKGHRAVKIRGSLNVSPIELTNRRVEAVREAIGPDVKLMVDVNGTWNTDLAIQQLKRWERFGLYWLEEPVPPDDIRGYAKVRANSRGAYIAGGEQHSGSIEFDALLDHVDIVQPGAGLVGGITEWLKVYHMATARGVPVSPWDLQAVHMHMAAGLPNVKWIEYFMPDNPMLEFQNRLFAKPRFDEVVTDDGVFLKSPTEPGLGIELDAAFAAEARIEG